MTRRRVGRGVLTLLGLYLAWTGAKGEDVFNALFPGPDLEPSDYVRWSVLLLGVLIVVVALWQPFQQGVQLIRSGLEGKPYRTREPQIALYLPEPACTRHPLEHNGVSLGRDAIYCHLGVKSTSGTVVKACRASLRRVARAENGQYVDDTRFTRPLRLKWANYMPTEPRAEVNDIDPDDPSLLDVVWSDEAAPGRVSIVTLDTGPIGIPKEFGPGTYRLTVRVSPEDSASVDYTVLLAVPEDAAFGAFLSPYVEGPPPKASPPIPLPQAGVATTAPTYSGGTVPADLLAGPTGADASPAFIERRHDQRSAAVFPDLHLELIKFSWREEGTNFVITLPMNVTNREEVTVSLQLELGFEREHLKRIEWVKRYEQEGMPLAVLKHNVLPPIRVGARHTERVELTYWVGRNLIEHFVRESQVSDRTYPSLNPEDFCLRLTDYVSGLSQDRRIALGEIRAPD